MSDGVDPALIHAWSAVVHPLSSCDAETAVGDDLQAVAELVGDARVVGLGESAHGSSQLFRLKHGVIKFLVTELGFSAVAIEASHAGSLAIDRYVRQGAGELAAALTGQGYTAWDCTEVAALLATLRRHNATVGPARMVAFWGLDSGYNAAGRSVLGPLLDTVDEDIRTRARHAFATLDDLEPRWPFQLNEPEFTKPLREVHDILNELDSALERAGDTRYGADARRLLEMMRRWSGPQRHDRSRQMGATLVELIDRAPAECRVVVWAHNGHVGRGGDASAPNLGDVLSARFGSGYVPLAFEFGGGSVQLRRLDADLALGEVVATPVEPAPVGSLPWCLTTTGHSALAVDLREARANPILDSWLQERPTEHALGWHLTDSSHFSEPWRSPKTYDGVLFVRDSTPTHPTPNARRAFTNRERF